MSDLAILWPRFWPTWCAEADSGAQLACTERETRRFEAQFEQRQGDLERGGITPANGRGIVLTTHRLRSAWLKPEARCRLLNGSPRSHTKASTGG